MIQVVRRVFRVGDKGVVRVEVTLNNTRTNREVVLVTERPDLDPHMWVDGMVEEPMAQPEPA